jgi:hypothetical protein
MIIHWEDIRWDVDEAGTSWATLADAAHDSLTLECRDGAITFHTDGSPRFDASTLMEITALCMVLAKEAVTQAGGAHHEGRIFASTSQPGDSDTYVPEQRLATDAQTGDADPAAARLSQAE